MALFLVCLLLQALVTGHALAALAYDPNDLSSYTRSIFLPYIHKFDSAYTPLISSTIFSKGFELPMDTGSTGIIIGAPRLPKISKNEGTPGVEFLDSSNLLYIGRFVNVSITFNGNHGETAMTKVPILVVDKSYYCPSYKRGNTCPDKHAVPNNLSEIGYMGVGFGRNTPKSGLPYAIPSHNPFLNVQTINGKYVSSRNFRTGYTVSTEGVWLGLTANNTKSYAFVKLDKGTTDDWRDWAGVNMSFTVDKSGPYHGSALIDTGINQSYIQAYPSGTITSTPTANPNNVSKTINVVKPSSHLSIGFPALGKKNVAGYDFKVGDKRFPSQPFFVQVVKSGPGPFINTGRNFLWGFSIGFDAVAGRMGFLCLKCGGGKGLGGWDGSS